MIPPLASLQAFEAVARRKSFSLAAAELHLTPSAISHQVAKLEDLFGMRLFERSTRGVELTPVGQSYLQRVGSALGAINSATDDLRHGVQDTLYVHSSPSFASLWLMPRIGRFAQLYPHISLVLSASHVHSDFQMGQMDIDIRYGLPNWPNLNVQPVFTERIMPLASPEFIRRHRIREPADLLEVPLIQSSVNLVQWPEWFAQHGGELRPDRMALRFDRAMMSMDAAVQSLGVALESAMLGRHHIDTGRLQSVFDADLSLEVKAHFVVYPARHASRPEVMSFVQWLEQEAQALNESQIA
jgi:DNA-binding transcriptional LysR family regulator